MNGLLARLTHEAISSRERQLKFGISDVVAREMCIGCGACSVVTQGSIQVTLNSKRLYCANLGNASESEIQAASSVCPFSDESLNEDQLGAPSGTHQTIQSHPILGSYSRTMVARVADDDLVLGSSSGGMASWLLSELIESGEIDGVIHVVAGNAGSGELFEYGISTGAQLWRSRKSAYYSVTMGNVLETVLQQGGRYAIVALPCFMRAIRCLCREMPEIADRIVMFVGLMCGHAKTQAYAESLAWQLGVGPSEIEAVDFRVKDFQQPSSSYSFGVRKKGEGWRVRRSSELVGSSWAYGAFQPEACNFCDDVVGETADVSVGDAWLPRYVQDGRGTNLLVSRSPRIDALLEAGARKGAIWVEDVSPDDVCKAQAGGVRHRRDGLALRLADDLKRGLPVPRKRVAADANAVSPRRAALVRQRRRMSELSHAAFAGAVTEGKIDSYLLVMRREVVRYHRLEASLMRRLFRRVRNGLRSLALGISRG